MPSPTTLVARHTTCGRAGQAASARLDAAEPAAACHGSSNARSRRSSSSSSSMRAGQGGYAFFGAVQEHVYNITIPATCLPHTGFAGVWTLATHAEFSNGTGPYINTWRRWWRRRSKIRPQRIERRRSRCPRGNRLVCGSGWRGI